MIQIFLEKTVANNHIAAHIVMAQIKMWLTRAAQKTLTRTAPVRRNSQFDETHYPCALALA